MKKLKYIMFWLLLALIIGLIAFGSFFKTNKVKAYNYNELDQYWQLEYDNLGSNNYRIYLYVNSYDWNSLLYEYENGTISLDLLVYGAGGTITRTINITTYYYSNNSYSFPYQQTSGADTNEPFYPDIAYYWSTSGTLTTSSYYYYKAKLTIEETGQTLISTQYVDNYSTLTDYIAYSNYWEGYYQGIADAEGGGASQEALEEAYNQGYAKGKDDVDKEWNSTATNWIWAFINGLQGFLSIKIGSVSIGTIVLIPLSITLAWFIIRQFRGGGGGD